MKPLELKDKPIFDKYFKEFPPEISEYTFTNLFMWRDLYQFLWTEKDHTLILISQKDSSIDVIFPPIGTNIKKAIEFTQQNAKAQNKKVRFERIPESILTIFKEINIPFEISEDRNNWDYIYATANLRDLPGKELANERKKLNKFKNDFHWEYLPVTEKEIPECIELQSSWCGVRACDDDPVLHTEDLAIREILQLWKELQLTGGILKVDGKIQAFTLGEALNSNTMVTHVEKANSEIAGLYQAINQQYAEKTAAYFKYINREQDLGIPNLRYAKENYHPIKMGKKFQIIFK
jgi:hypothetical protein